MASVKGRLLATVSVAFLLAFAGAALGAGAVGGASYSGRLKPGHGVPLSDGVPITLKVSSTAKKVTVGIEGFPLFCEGGGPPPTATFKPAKIESGKFKATGSEEFEGTVIATAAVTGKFVTGGKAKGTFEDKFTKAPTCSGKTTYTVKVAPN